MSWGNWIVVAFIVFALFIGSLVTVCVRQDVALVSKAYYRDELNYQAQMDRGANTAALRDKPAIRFTGGNAVEIRYADFGLLEKGELILYAPSDARRDRTIPLTAHREAQQVHTVEELSPGMYKAKMTWTMGGKEFYHEEIIYR